MPLKIAEKFLLTDFLRILHVLPANLRWKIYFLFLLMFVVAIFEVLSILSMSFTAMSVAAPQMIIDHPSILKLMDSMPKLREICSDLRYLTLIASLSVVFLTIIKNSLIALLTWKQSRVSEEVSTFAGAEIMANYLAQPYIWHLGADSNATSVELEARFSLSQALLMILNIYTYTFTSIALVFVLVSATPLMIMAVLVFTGFLAWCVYWLMRNYLDKAGVKAYEATAGELQARKCAMRGIREVLIYRQQPVFLQKFLDACLMGSRPRAFLSMAPPIPTWVLEVYGFITIPFTTWILIRFYNADMALIAGVVTMIMLAAWRVLPLFNRSLHSMVALRGVRKMAMTCLERLEQIEKRMLTPEPDPDFKFERDITLEDVSFHYPGIDHNALQNVTCAIKKGRHVGLVGLSGSGKSTMACILSGLCSPDTGKFLVDGKELTERELVSYRAKIGFVPQAPYLLEGSIAENVAFSQWGKPWDEKKVRQVCEMAALNFGTNEARDIDCQIGENGAGLSGGQSQRVSIARALYADPEILILDESTSSLDQQTESEIMVTINNLKNRLTLIIIAHRLTTVEQCDWIIWLEHGRIKKQGPTEQILREYKEYMVPGNHR